MVDTDNFSAWTDKVVQDSDEVTGSAPNIENF
jgi:hypothetical protein